MLGQQGPSVVLNGLFKSVPLTLDGPCVLLLMGRDARLECDFHDCPPDDAMEQAGCLLRLPWPIAEGTGMHNPTVVHRHVVPPPCGAPPRVSS